MQSIIVPFSRAANCLHCRRRDLLLWARPAAPCPLCRRMTEAEGPTRIIQVVLWTLCFKQYRASWCVHEVSGLKFIVARQTEVEISLMKAARCEMTRCSGESKAVCVSLQHTALRSFKLAENLFALRPSCTVSSKTLQAASPQHKLQIQKLSLDWSGRQI